MARRRLNVNIDHVATLRQARRSRYPDPLALADSAQTAGADKITAHLREDRRHVQEHDLELLRRALQTPLNLKMAPTGEMAKLAYALKPDQVTLVSERPDELTTESGLDLEPQREHLRRHVQGLRDADIQVCVSVDPDLEQVRAAHRLGATCIELHTGKYADARGERDQRAELQRIADAGRAAAKLGLRVAAGHGLNYRNIEALVPIDDIEEYVVGHAIVCRALLTGMGQAVRDMMALLRA